jgi:hypothetical protein
MKSPWEWQSCVVWPWQSIIVDRRQASWFDVVKRRRLPDGTWEYRSETDSEMAQQQNDEAW